MASDWTPLGIAPRPIRPLAPARPVGDGAPPVGDVAAGPARYVQVTLSDPAAAAPGFAKLDALRAAVAERRYMTDSEGIASAMIRRSAR